MSDFTSALLIAGRLTTDAMGRTVPDPVFRRELRDMQPESGTGKRTALDSDQKARVRELRSEGKTHAQIAQIIGTSYHRVQQVD